MKLRLLGCGTSTGVPRIGNDWGACDPGEPRNRRTRCSALLETPAIRILIDTGPDMREQLNAAGVSDVDAVIWTHDHADHVHGIDDLRQVAQNRGGVVAGYARPFARARIEPRFDYVFHGSGGYPPTVQLADLCDEQPIGDVNVGVVDQPHGAITSAGLIFERDGKRVVYSTDFHSLTDQMRDAFSGCDIWVLDALRVQPHPSHNHFDLALEHVAAVAPRRAVLIHMDNSVDYAAFSSRLPAGVELGYDGMELIP